MNVTLQLLGQLRHLAGEDELALSVEDGASLTDFLEGVANEQGDEFTNILLDSGAIRSSMMVLVNEVPVDKSAPPALSDGDTITLLPAIAGG